jgi:hypothetical protein
VPKKSFAIVAGPEVVVVIGKKEMNDAEGERLEDVRKEVIGMKTNGMRNAEVSYILGACGQPRDAVGSISITVDGAADCLSKQWGNPRR